MTMSVDESSPEYASFLRSGAYPFATGQFNRTDRRSLRIAGLAALAFLAGAAGYALTHWAIPHGQPLPGANDDQQSTRDVSAEDPDGDVVAGQGQGGRKHSNGNDAVLSNSVTRTPSGDLVARPHVRALRDSQHAAVVGSARKLGLNPNDQAEVSVGAIGGPTGQPVSGSPAELDMLSAEGLRSQLIADRVRALDEANTRAAAAGHSDAGK